MSTLGAAIFTAGAIVTAAALWCGMFLAPDRGRWFLLCPSLFVLGWLTMACSNDFALQLSQYMARP